ncbi:solute carrier family 35, member E1 [Kwoniella mangroviensis CBS 10435]|uniref:Solute carrier family 35, member E1 n=1 Tax=Kwoniella mangroviensis CBS 10435 TaxID=1331196 RepID=A0A1B9IXX9_9TREE|nr:solute carrier family 35, member E1 [Kwoniella mangroviensis CBS 10435]
MSLLPDSRQRAPFAHQSSSADLRSAHNLSSLRSPPSSSHPQAPWIPSSISPEPQSNQHQQSYRPEKSSSLWGAPLTRKDSNDLSPGGYADNPYDSSVPGNSYLVDGSTGQRRNSISASSSRASSPGPFSLPQFSIPGFATIRFVSLCFLWYTCSAVSNNTGKVILNNFKYPVTLTIVQFFFVAGCCIICSRPELGWTPRLRSPTRAILKGILPMAAFQVGGHIFGSLAISRVPVSTVHTIKALSPLFTVMAYALLFGVSYSPATYLSLLPLTLGVMLASSADISFNNFFGLVCALGSTVIFVTQNIFFKKIMPTPGSTETGGATPKLDKINLLYFSSGMAFLLMIPVWLYSDAWRLLDLWLHPIAKSGGPSVSFYFFINGTVHFAQNLIAFSLLSSTSPVTYSIASLVKRIAVICLAIIWFKQSVFFVQAMGIALTAVGLWMYNNAKRDVEKGEKKMRQVEAVREGMLPTTKVDQRILEGRANLDPLAYGGKASPKPTYPTNYNHQLQMPLSTSTSFKKALYTQPPPPPTANSLTQTKTAHINAEASYPSPPNSITSSPPAEPVFTNSHPRHRRLSESKQDGFRLPPAITARSSTIEEEGSGMSMDTAKVGIVA